jgi:hypothetical protein
MVGREKGWFLMGCDDYPLVGIDGYNLGDVVAELWCDRLARRFPHTSHSNCFQAMRLVDGQYNPVPFIPARCQDWHCPKCGASTGMYGHQECEAGS